MAQFCLVPQVAERFKKDILSGEIDPEKLALMTSAQRRSFFAEHLGEASAEPVNALFESKLLLKNQKQGMVSWARKLLKTEGAPNKDIISKINRLEKPLDAASEEAFLEDLVAQRLGTRVSFEEAQKITELSQKVRATKGVGDRMDYGRAATELQNYVRGLKGEAEKMTLAEAKKNPGKALGRAVSNIAGNAKAIQASMDNSAIFRQGWKSMLTNPKIWGKNALKSFEDIVRTFGGKQVIDEVNADYMSRPNHNLMVRAKLSVGNAEEAFPTSLPEKIPFIGRAYKASEAAYTAFVQRVRMDTFDKYIDIANKSSVELNNDELVSIGKLVNSLTGRANLGSLEPVANVINNVFFSPRMLRAQIDTLIHPITGAGGSNFVRKQAAKNLLKIVMGSAAILGIAKAIDSESVDFDPRSANFGKIKVGNTRFNVTGGLDSLVTLASRLITQSSKSSITGKVTQLNSGKFGSRSGTDVVYNFLENKLSPAAAVVKDLLKGQTFSGEKPTLKNQLTGHFLPLPATNAYEAYNTPGAANILLILAADGLGVSTNTYAPEEKKKK